MSLLRKVKEESEKAGLKLNIQKTKIMASSPITSRQIDGETMETMLFSWVPKSLQMVTAAMKLEDTPWKKSHGQPRQYIKKERYSFADKGQSSQSYGFFPVVRYGCESWTIKKAEAEELMLLNCGFKEDSWSQIEVRSPLNCKEIKPVNPKGDQCWIFIGRTDAEAEAPILWPPDGKNWFIGKDPDARKDWRQEEKGTTEDEMVGWHHQLEGHEFEQAPGVGDGQGSLACCSSWGHKESDTTEQLNWSFEDKGVLSKVSWKL